MIIFKIRFASSITLAALAALSFPSSSSAAPRSLDPDRDGKISLVEAEVAGARKFASMDRDRDGIQLREARGVLRRFFKTADSNGDGVVDKAEYNQLVDEAFAKADVEGDSEIDAKELASPAGRALLRLIR